LEDSNVKNRFSKIFLFELFDGRAFLSDQP
jgi:hypothetical protein